MPVLPSDRERIDGATWTHRFWVSKVLLELRFPTAIPRAVSKSQDSPERTTTLGKGLRCRHHAPESMVSYYSATACTANAPDPCPRSQVEPQRTTLGMSRAQEHALTMKEIHSPQ